MQDPLHMFMTTNYEPLTPLHLIYGRHITTNPNSSHHKVVSTNRSLTRRARHHKLLLEQFIKQWRTEYLTGLREQTSVTASVRGSGSSISEGDIVIVKGIRPQERFGDWHKLNNYSLERMARQDQPLLS